MKNNFKKLHFFLSVLMLVLSSFTFLFVYIQTKENNRIANEAMNTWSVKEQERRELKSLQQSINVFASEIRDLNTHFAFSGNVVPFLNTLESLAWSTSSTPEITSVDTEKDNGTLVVKMNAEGSFESLYKFIKLIENSPYEIEFRAVDISRPGAIDGARSPSSEWKVFLTLRLLTFIQ